MRLLPGLMRSLAFTAALLVALASSGAARTPQQASSPPAAPAEPAQVPGQPPIRSEANFVRVDVYPTRGDTPVRDLTAGDFEVREDGVVQKVETFEHVVVRPAGPQSERRDPSSQREMLEAAANPRTRVFIIFLDTAHVRVEGSHFVARPIIRLINRILGPDDLVGVMTPGMSTNQITLARKTEVTEQQLIDNWTWGQRFSFSRDEREYTYEDCGLPPAILARKRERATLEAMQDLVRWLYAIREERKAVITVTEGWALFTPDRTLLEPRSNPLTGQREPVPSTPPIGVGPDGRLTTKDPRYADVSTCQEDRMKLANIDDEDFLRQIIADANRSNATFYPVDPRGLAAFDFPIYEGVPLAADRGSLRNRQNSLHDLALGTDGLAVMDSNDLDTGLKRISDDLSSYYLLGYYSSNASQDGGYRKISVKVTQPGVDVRSRRGYRAPSREDVLASRKAEAAPAVDAAAPLEAALGDLSRVMPASRLRLQIVRAPDGDRLWIAGELPVPERGAANPWTAGGSGALMIVAGPSSVAAGSGRVTIAPGQRAFITSIALPRNAALPIEVQARFAPEDGAAALETFRLTAADVRPLYFHRSPTTGNQQVPAASPVFLRSDRVHLELPVAEGVEGGEGRLLDRNGQPLGIPVTIAVRTDADTNQRFITADLALAPLAPADYIVEIGTREGGTETRVLAGIRVSR